MKLSLDSFENLIPLDTDFVSVISVQSVHYYAKLLRSFYFGSNGMHEEIELALIDDEEKRLPISSMIEFIPEVLLVDFSSKHFSNALIGLLKQELNNNVEIRIDIENALKTVQKKVISVIDDFDLPLIYNEAWDAAKIIKATSIALDCSTEGLTHFEILDRYIQIAGELKIKSYHCFAGLNNVLTSEEMSTLFKTTLQRQVKLLCIQHDISCPPPSKYAHITFIDDDFEEHVISPFLGR